MYLLAQQKTVSKTLALILAAAVLLIPGCSGKKGTVSSSAVPDLGFDSSSGFLPGDDLSSAESVTQSGEEDAQTDVSEGKGTSSKGAAQGGQNGGQGFVEEPQPPETVPVDASNMSVKKGVGASRYGNGSTDSLNKLGGLNMGWYYNWGISEPKPSSGLEYVPMMWGAGSVNSQNISKIKSYHQNGGYRNLLTFNEPDLQAQSNMTVDQAIALWPKLEAIGIRLGSPCPADPYGNWLNEFMNKAREKGYRVDFIAIHCYQDFSNPGSVNELKELLTNLYDKYQLPIWLTEFGAIDVSVWGGSRNPNCTEAAAKTYIAQSVAMLESLGFVERYAWFLDNFNETGSRRPAEAAYTSLYQDNNTLSSTGTLYQSVASVKGLLFATGSLPKAELGQPYNAKVEVKGGSSPYTFSAAGLPPGLNMDSATGAISGTPAGPGSYQATITVRDAAGHTNYRRYTLMNASAYTPTKLPKSGWSGKCSYFNLYGDWNFTDLPARELVDGQTSTAYTMNRTMKALDVFQVLFPQPVTLQMLRIDSPSGSQAKQFKVQYQNAKGVWSDCPLLSKSVGAQTQLIFTVPLTANGILIQLTETDASRTWAVSEISAYRFP